MNLRGSSLFVLAVSIGIAAAGLQAQAPAGAGAFPVPERPSAAVARRVPQFGGMYIGSDRALHFYGKRLVNRSC